MEKASKIGQKFYGIHQEKNADFEKIAGICRFYCRLVLTNDLPEDHAFNTRGRPFFNCELN